MDPNYDECGEWCGDKQEPQNFYCDECPMKAASDAFECEAIERLQTRAKDHWQKYGFDLLLQTVLDVMKIEQLPSAHITAKCGRLIAAKNSEVTRRKRLDAWNEKTKEANQSE